MYHIQN